jgi:glutamine amidotransferase
LKKVGIVNYNSGNIRSIISAVSHVGLDSILLNNKNDINKVSYIILPGVGSFGHCATELKKNFIYKNLKEKNIKLPILGICVGYQLLFQSSQEDNGHCGLNFFNKKMIKFPEKDNFKVPHAGWNEVIFKKNCGFFQSKKKYNFYFDHSYMVKPFKNTIGVTQHSELFTSVVQIDNILACQFHPEKSQNNGLEFLKYFFNNYA